MDHDRAPMYRAVNRSGVRRMIIGLTAAALAALAAAIAAARALEQQAKPVRVRARRNR